QRPQMAEPRKLKDWQKIMGVIGSGLTAMGGGRPTFAQNLLEERQRAEAAQQRFDLAEYEGKIGRANKTWEWQNEPTKPTAWSQNRQDIERLYGPDAAKIWALSKPVTGPDGITRWIMPDDI